jgi:hypothetical protein
MATHTKPVVRVRLTLTPGSRGIEGLAGSLAPLDPAVRSLAIKLLLGVAVGTPAGQRVIAMVQGDNKQDFSAFEAINLPPPAGVPRAEQPHNTHNSGSGTDISPSGADGAAAADVNIDGIAAVSSLLGEA